MLKTQQKIFSSFLLLFSLNLFSADLPVIAITEIKSSVDSSYYRDYKNSKALNFQTMLETQIVQTNRFKVIERNRINEVLSEQILQGEFSDANTKTKAGAVDYIVYGSVTKFGSKKKRIETSGISVTKIISEFGVDLKVVDVLNGEIVKAETIDIVLETGAGTTTSSFRTSDTLADPLSDIQRAAAKSAASLIAESIFPIKIVAWEDDTKDCCGYLNYGDSILSLDDILVIVKQGKSFIDPDTGLELGSTEKVIGKLQVTETLDKFSKAKLIEGAKPKGGELARSVSKKSNQPGQVKERKRQGRKL